MKPFSFFPACLTLGLVLSVAGCADPETESSAAPSEAEVQRVTETGKKAATALMQQLGGQLKGAIQNGGPVEAVEVCQVAALPLTAAAGAEFEGVSIRRTTLKPRNPANAPDALDRSVLERLASQAQDQAEPIVEWTDEMARYYQPLYLQALCLNCHGDPASFSEDLVNVLAKSYPEDQATGYEVGDLRGVIRVDVTRSPRNAP